MGDFITLKAHSQIQGSPMDPANVIEKTCEKLK